MAESKEKKDMELAVADEKALATAEPNIILDEDDAAMDFDGLALTLDKYKIPSGGSLVFTVAGPEGSETTPTIEGVILYRHPSNGYYANEYDGGRGLPDCFSIDGKVSADGKDCSTCQYNQFGSGKNGGKACSNRQVIYILPGASPLPAIMMLPPTATKNWSNYMVQLKLKNKAFSTVITEISLEKDKNAKGIEYSKPKFKAIGNLTQEEYNNLKSLRDFCVQHSHRLLESGGMAKSDFVDGE